MANKKEYWPWGVNIDLPKAGQISITALQLP